MPTPFVTACKQFFGLQPGQGLREFAAEVKQLTQADKLEIAAGLRKNGIDCTDPEQAA